MTLVVVAVVMIGGAVAVYASVRRRKRARSRGRKQYFSVDLTQSTPPTPIDPRA